MEKPFLSNNIKLDEEALKKIFLYNLNQIHLILLHLTEVLPVIATITCYGDLQNAVDELLSEVKVQIFRIDDIFILLKEAPAVQSATTSNKISQLLTHEYHYEQMDSLSKDISLVFHLQKILSIKKNYFHILKSIANSLNSKNIKQYLQYSYDDCEDNHKNFMLIAKEYMESNINNFLR